MTASNKTILTSARGIWFLFWLAVLLLAAPPRSVVDAWMTTTKTARTTSDPSRLHRTSRTTTGLIDDPDSRISFDIIPRRTISSSLTATTTSSSTTDAASSTTIWTRQQLKDYAARQGLVISLSTLGPGYRAIARAQHNTTLILGYIEGFVRPVGNILHMDKMEVYKPIMARARVGNPQLAQKGGPWLGIGLLLAYLCLLEFQTICHEAEFLAIDDADFQHKRLVRLYRASGFQVIKYVGDDWTSVPDRLLWGGCGTLMRQEIDTLLPLWTKLLEKNQQRIEKSNSSTTS